MRRPVKKKTTELELAEDAALAAAKRVQAALLKAKPDFKAAAHAQKTIARFIRLRNEQVAAMRPAIRPTGLAKRRKKGRA